MSNYDKYIEDALAAIPETLRDKLQNVAFVVEDAFGPPCDCGEEDCELETLGLYEGVPLTERDHEMTEVLPDVITLFRQSIEDEAQQTGMPVAQVVHETVWHEVSHYFGFDEEQADRMERKWEQNLT